MEKNVKMCHICGKELENKDGTMKEGIFQVSYLFSYPASLDGEKHKFSMCERCYQKMISSFRVPVERENMTEYL